MLVAEMPGSIYAFPCIALAPAGRPSFQKTIGPGGLGAIRGNPVIWLAFLGVNWFFMLSEMLPHYEWLPEISVTHLGFRVTVTDSEGHSATERMAYGE